jgi:acyl-coenzyme A thioesterase PaaI-like protein
MRGRSYGTISPEQQKAMSGLEFVKGLASGTLPLNTFAQTVGYDVVEAESGRVAITLTPTGAHLNPWGTVHGGLTATLLDSCMGLAIQSMLDRGMSSTTVRVQDFARPSHHLGDRRDQGRGQSHQLWPSCWHSGRPRHGRRGPIARARHDDLSHFCELTTLRRMSALRLISAMSALPPKADMCSAIAHVCFGPKADIVRFIRSPRRRERTSRRN